MKVVFYTEEPAVPIILEMLLKEYPGASIENAANFDRSDRKLCALPTKNKRNWGEGDVAFFNMLYNNDLIGHWKVYH